MGRLTRDPELRYTQSQTPVVSFTLAVDRDFSDNGRQKQTDFIDCVAWRHTAEFVSRYFSKGSMAVVTGRLQLRDWTDTQGQKRRTAEVVADSVYFGESRRDSYQQGYQQGYQSYQQPLPQNTQSAANPYGDTQTYSSAGDYHQTTFTELDDSDGELPF
jgi:single-strand DNA-binding protein